MPHLFINQLNLQVAHLSINQNILVMHLFINQLKSPGDAPIHQSIITSSGRTYPSIDQNIQVTRLFINQSKHAENAPIHQSSKTSRWRTYPLSHQNIQLTHLSINQNILSKRDIENETDYCLFTNLFLFVISGTRPHTCLRSGNSAILSMDYGEAWGGGHSDR